jgi:methionyl-tRNA synthetase
MFRDFITESTEKEPIIRDNKTIGFRLYNKKGTNFNGYVWFDKQVNLITPTPKELKFIQGLKEHKKIGGGLNG